jgi:nicotinamide riboside kinase
MQLAVLNPGGRDREQRFHDGAGAPDSDVHAPVNYHAYAACTGGGFFREARAIPGDMNSVLLLLRRDLKAALAALESLRSQGKFIAVSWKESGLHQIAKQLDSAVNLRLFREICSRADGALSSTPELVPLYRAAGAKEAEFIATPYPVEDPRWDFSRPLPERHGIFIGTREWDVPSRNHAAALLRACATGATVTVFNEDGRGGRKKLEALGCANLRVIEGRRPYAEYLRSMAECRVVFQLDTSAVPGQVAGDALLCRMPCLGGNGAVDRLAFGDSDLELLLENDKAWHEEVARSQARARENLGFSAVGERLRQFFARLRRAAV